MNRCILETVIKSRLVALAESSLRPFRWHESYRSWMTLKGQYALLWLNGTS